MTIPWKHIACLAGTRVCVCVCVIIMSVIIRKRETAQISLREKLEKDEERISQSASPSPHQTEPNHSAGQT